MVACRACFHQGRDMKSLFSRRYFEDQKHGAERSAAIAVPLVMSLFPVRSVIDVGCGLGIWLAEFERHGVGDYLGIDGDYLARETLRIPEDRFRATDLQALTEVGRRFDLACSLEVAQYLPESCAPQFVSALVKAAPVVLFSSAIPRQSGTACLNEKYQSYWQSLFAGHGYVAVDCIRPAVHGNADVAWWYKQNTIVYCSPEHCPRGYEPTSSGYDLDRLVPEMTAGPKSGSQAALAMRQSIPVLAGALRRRVGL